MGWEEAHSASAAYSSSFCLVHVAVVHAADLEHALGQGAGLVEHHRPDLRQRLQIVGALDEDALVAGAADTGEEAQGDADHQRAGAAGHKEGQRAVDPLLPLTVHTAQHSRITGGSTASASAL